MDRHGPRFAPGHRPLGDGADGFRQFVSSRGPLGRDAVLGPAIGCESSGVGPGGREFEAGRGGRMSERDGSTGPSEIVRLGDEEAAVQVLSQAVLGLWEVVNSLTRLRPSRRRRYRVTIFGSARTDPDHWVCAAVRDLAGELTRLG